MSSIASLLMVGSGALCLTGAVASKARLAAATSSVMLLAMADMAFTGVLPPVVWAGVLLVVGLCVAASLRRSPGRASGRSCSAAAVVVAVGATGRSESVLPIGRPGSGGGRLEGMPHAPGPRGFPLFALFPHPERAAAILSALAYPVMAWQVVRHGAHAGDASGGSATAHQHHGHVFDPSFIGMFISWGGAVLALLLLLCAVQSLARRRPLQMLECLGMAAMVSVMQFHR